MKHSYAANETGRLTGGISPSASGGWCLWKRQRMSKACVLIQTVKKMSHFTIGGRYVRAASRAFG
eukprot:2885559-Prymnesium_polylepis.2